MAGTSACRRGEVCASGYGRSGEPPSVVPTELPAGNPQRREAGLLPLDVPAGPAGELVEAAAAEEPVPARAADQRVAAAASLEDVVAGLPEQPVLAGAADQLVLALAAADQVVAAETADDVVAAERDDDVAPRGPADDVATGGADSGGLFPRALPARPGALVLAPLEGTDVAAPLLRPGHVPRVGREAGAGTAGAARVEGRAGLGDRVRQDRPAVVGQRGELRVLAAEVTGLGAAHELARGAGVLEQVVPLRLQDRRRGVAVGELIAGRSRGVDVVADQRIAQEHGIHRPDASPVTVAARVRIGRVAGDRHVVHPRLNAAAAAGRVEAATVLIGAVAADRHVVQPERGVGRDPAAADHGGVAGQGDVFERHRWNRVEDAAAVEVGHASRPPVADREVAEPDVGAGPDSMEDAVEAAAVDDHLALTYEGHRVVDVDVALLVRVVERAPDRERVGTRRQVDLVGAGGPGSAPAEGCIGVRGGFRLAQRAVRRTRVVLVDRGGDVDRRRRCRGGAEEREHHAQGDRDPGPHCFSTSFPAPPTSLSLPPPPLSSSAPLPPNSLSPPPPPRRVSLPASPASVSPPASPSMKSGPPPPFMLSAPLPPKNTSTPGPPSTLSLPPSPQIRSLPPKPRIVSLPPCPAITSRFEVPRITSGPAVPSFVTTVALHSAGGGGGGGIAGSWSSKAPMSVASQGRAAEFGTSGKLTGRGMPR